MKQKNKWIKFGIPCALLIALAAVITTLVVAYYIKDTGEVTNEFIPADPVTPEVTESFDGTEKKDVSFEVGDTGYPVYVRVAIVVTWKDEDGVVYFKKPVLGTDYSLMTTDPESGWEYDPADGYYYYINKVESGDSTPVLIQSSKQLDTANPPEGYTLSVEIIVQTVQAIGTTDDDEYQAWQDAWKNFDNASGATTTEAAATETPEIP